MGRTVVWTAGFGTRRSGWIVGAGLLLASSASAALAQTQALVQAQTSAQAPAARTTPAPAAASSPAPAPSPAGATVAAKPPVTGPFPADAFARLPLITGAQLSPNGLYMAGLLGVSGQQRIGILNVIGKGDTPVQLAIPDGTEANWVQWVNDDNIIVGLRALLPVEGDRWYISRLIAVNRTTGKVTRIYWDSAGQNASQVLWTAADGTPQILLSAQDSIYLDQGFWPSVYRVDVSTGRKSRVQAGRTFVMNWNVDAAGTVRAGVAYDNGGRKAQLVYRGEGGGAGLRVIDRADDRKREGLFWPFLFLQGGDHALVMHDDDGGRTAIYEVDLATLSDVRQVYAAPAGAEVERPILSRDGRTLLGAATSDAAGVHWIDPQLAEIQANFDRSVSGRRATILSLSQDRNMMLVHVARPGTPGNLYYFSTQTGRLQMVAMMNEALAGASLASGRMVKYAARDGTEIEAVLTMPPADRDTTATGSKALPIIMMPHGGPWVRDTLDYDYWAQFLANRGYIVMQPNFRGSTGYGTAFLRKGEGQLGLAMQDDVTDGLRWAVAQGLADPARACIVGASYGGYAAMWGVAKDPDLYRCAVSIAGVSSLRREVDDFGNMLMGGKYRDDWKRMTPDFAAVSPINAVDRITVPLLLIHGKRDVTVDYSHSSRMADRMRGAGKAVDYLLLPQADHYFTREADRLALLQALETFLAKHNPAGIGSAAAALPATRPVAPLPAAVSPTR